MSATESLSTFSTTVSFDEGHCAQQRAADRNPEAACCGNATSVATQNQPCASADASTYVEDWSI